MIHVLGGGWIDPEGHGWIRSERDGAGAPDRNETFSVTFRNFGRLDVTSRATCYAIALALKDAGVEYPLLGELPVGVVGTSANGCVDSDAAYFKDYLDGNRILGRGNLFIYTLPTSPLGEAAIHFGLAGPLFHVGATRGRLATAVRHAREVMDDQGLEMMLAGLVDGNSAIYIVLSRDPGDRTSCTVATVEAVLSEDEPVRDVARRIRKAAAAGVR